jgi:hypothetical protein
MGTKHMKLSYKKGKRTKNENRTGRNFKTNHRIGKRSRKGMTLIPCRRINQREKAEGVYGDYKKTPKKKGCQLAD